MWANHITLPYFFEALQVNRGVRMQFYGANWYLQSSYCESWLLLRNWLSETTGWFVPPERPVHFLSLLKEAISMLPTRVSNFWTFSNVLIDFLKSYKLKNGEMQWWQSHLTEGITDSIKRLADYLTSGWSVRLFLVHY